MSHRHVLTACALVSMLAIAADRSDPARPLIFAHRGASAYLPEHTLEAYTLAYAQGADYIEPDVVLTKDGVLVCSHDVSENAGSTLAAAYPERARADGEWYYIDFTLDELRSIGASPGAGGTDLPGLTIATLDEMIALVRLLNERLGRDVGVIPEPKSPAFHREQGRPIERALVDALEDHGYSERDHKAIIQCFELDALEVIRHELGCELPLVYLSGDAVSDETLDRVAAFADGIGPSRKLIETDDGGPGEDPDIIRRARARGLAVYPYTFGESVQRQRRFFRHHRVEGLFSDNPDIAVRARN